jgi:ATP-dependent DNA helicase RecG
MVKCEILKGETQMTNEELLQQLKYIQNIKCETQTLELKSAEKGCPTRLYDSLSSFSNQDSGGIIVFGVDEAQDYKEVGVYDAQDIQKKINEQCLQMEPIVRPILTVVEKDGKTFAAAEIPGVDLAERPCYYKGKGRLKGSYTRIGDSDEPMTEYEIYSYEAYRKKYQDDIREVKRASLQALDKTALNKYILLLKGGKPKLDEQSIYELMSITRNRNVTLSSVLLFGLYPQAYFPQFCITAVVVPGKEIGEVDSDGARFLDNARIEGTIPEILEEAIAFVKRNMRKKIIINPETGKREDRTDYPVTAIREAILNALVHRDYSIHTEGMPIQVLMFEDRIEIRNPGGIYGRMSIDQLGKVQADTRNPVLALALEVLGITENRYSGIPTIRREMKAYNLVPAEFFDERGNFIVKFYKKMLEESNADNNLIDFCRTPRSRKEICEFLGVKSVSYAMKRYIQPLIERGEIKLTMPDTPKSTKQKYFS